MKIKYYANFSTNGTSIMNGIAATNKAKLIKSIRILANSNRLLGNSCTWQVWEAETGIPVAAGGTRADGTMYRTEC